MRSTNHSNMMEPEDRKLMSHSGRRRFRHVTEKQPVLEEKKSLSFVERMLLLPLYLHHDVCRNKHNKLPLSPGLRTSANNYR